MPGTFEPCSRNNLENNGLDVTAHISASKYVRERVIARSSSPENKRRIVSCAADNRVRPCVKRCTHSSALGMYLEPGTWRFSHDNAHAISRVSAISETSQAATTVSIVGQSPGDLRKHTHTHTSHTPSASRRQLDSAFAAPESYV